MDDGFRTSDDEYSAALDLIEADDYEAALPILGRLVAFEPNDDYILANWLDAHLTLERYGQVIDIADAAIARGRPRASLELWKAVAYGRLGEVERAEAAARASLAIEPSSDATIVLSSILTAQDRRAEALELCRAMAAENPDDEDLAFEVISLQRANGLYQSVVQSARDYLRRFEKSASVLSLLGDAHVELKGYRKAERAFRDAAALDPDNPDHHFHLVMTFLIRGDRRAAEVYLEKLAARDADVAGQVSDAVDEIMEDVEARVADEAE